MRALGEAVEKHSPPSTGADPGETPELRGRLRNAADTGQPESYAGVYCWWAVGSGQQPGDRQSSNRHVGLHDQGEAPPSHIWRGLALFVARLTTPGDAPAPTLSALRKQIAHTE